MTTTLTPVPTEWMTEDQLKDFARELDAIRDEVMNSLGDRDRTYFYQVLQASRVLTWGGRGALTLSARLPLLFPLGVASLALGKILNNMEVGHNVLHGQWDWLQDEKISSKTWEWDFATPAKAWRKTHNAHHAWTNVVGKDNDVGYNDYVRVSRQQTFLPSHYINLLKSVGLALIFDLGIAFYDTEYEEMRAGKKSREAFLKDLKLTGKKWAGLVVKEYGSVGALAFLLGGKNTAAKALGGVLAANVIRNVWAHTIIFCGHFPEETVFFTEEEVKRESRGRWYLRQLLGSANISGGKVIDILSGHLSKQVEHHLFPKMPSHRLPEVSSRVKALATRYNLPYHEGPLPKQVASTWRALMKHSTPKAI